MWSNNIYKEIYKKIKKYDTIVLARHIGPDPDALASQLALKDIILHTFPEKKVYAVGCSSSRFHYLGNLDKFDGESKNALLIVTDTPDKKRVDGIDDFVFKDSIKIDHHPFIQKFCNTEWIDDTTSSASQMIVELTYLTKLKMTEEAAKKLYIGIVSDTNRFLFSYTSEKTFLYTSKLLKDYRFDFKEIYDSLYLRPLKELKFQGYIESHLKVTEYGFAYIKITDDILKEYDVDAATAGNMINNFNYINEIYAWATFTEDVKNNNIRGSIRSRGPIINDVAAKFRGGGHMYASGVKPMSFEEVDLIIDALNQRCKEYKNQNE